MKTASKYRKNFIYIGVFLFALIAFLGFLEHLDHTTDYNYKKVHANSGELFVSLYYPQEGSGGAVVGRMTHGKESHTTNMPWGKNDDQPNSSELPRLYFSRDVVFNGKPIDKGMYYLYLVPRKIEMAVYLYQYLETTKGEDTFMKGNMTQTLIPIQPSAKSQENPGFSLISENDNTVNFEIQLDNIKVEIPIKVVN